MPTEVIATLSNQQRPQDDARKKKTWMSFIQDTDNELDKCTAWRVCFCCSLASMINLGSAYTYGLFFPSILDEFQAGKAATALAGSVTVALSALLAPIASKLCDRFGCRLTMIGGGLTTAIAQLGSSFAPNVYVLLLSYGVGFGFASCLVFISAMQIVPLYFNRHRSLGLAILNSGNAGGLLFMTPVIQKLLEHFDWRKAMMILAALNTLPCFLGCSINRKMKHTSQNTRDNSQTKLTKQWTKLLKTSVLMNPVFMLLCLTMSVACLGYIMPSIHLAKYAEDLGIPISSSSWMYFAIGIASLISRILTGKLCDTGWISHLCIFQLAVVVFGIIDVSLPLATSLTFLIVYSVMYGICEGVIMTSMHSYILITFPGMGFGWYCTFMGLSYLIGPVFAGVIADFSGSYHPAFITAGVFLFVSASLPLFMRFIHNTSTPEEVKLKESTDKELVILEKMTVL
ncbi:monocarboxylate transporter 13-like [Actinia tenebrosa]|uniref:Monocarboxylate transporter 13-like n=1 Tax=Actinia tenebrosa TaxID=6105 RepID=A0A6P8I5C1_ACTTE|nr:monocarboxylate transporter 13-like [Actinia tenebrosa]XP_031560148.1 monocarboxylate transporter 13-like [Actinia tenebrosa]